MLVKGKSVAFHGAARGPVDGCIRNVDSVPRRIAVGSECDPVSVRHLNWIGSDVVIGRPGRIKRWIGQVAEEHILRECIEKESVAGANHCLAGSENVPGDCYSWRKILVVGLVNVRQTSGANSLQVARSG